MAEEIIELLRSRPEYIEYLERIIKAEEELGDSNWGWEPGQIGIPGHVIRILLDNNIIKRVYASRRHREYRLTIPLEEARRAINEVKSKPQISYRDIATYAMIVTLHPEGMLKILEYIEDLIEAGRLRGAVRIFEKISVRVDRLAKLYDRVSRSQWKLLKEKQKLLQRVLDKTLEIALKIDEKLKELEETPPQEVARRLGYID